MAKTEFLLVLCNNPIVNRLIVSNLIVNRLIVSNPIVNSLVVFNSRMLDHLLSQSKAEDLIQH